MSTSREGGCERYPLTNRGVQVTAGWDLDAIRCERRTPDKEVGAPIRSDVSARPQGVVAEGPLPLRQRTKLLLGRAPGGQAVVLDCLANTARFYGWEDAFQPWIPGLRVDPVTGHEFVMGPRLKKRRDTNGRIYRICRAKTTSGQPAGMTNSFRIAGPVTNRILSELAAYTRPTWSWMSSKWGERRSREQWLHIHDAIHRGEEVPPT